MTSDNQSDASIMREMAAKKTERLFNCGYAPDALQEDKDARDVGNQIAVAIRALPLPVDPASSTKGVDWDAVDLPIERQVVSGPAVDALRSRKEKGDPASSEGADTDDDGEVWIIRYEDQDRHDELFSSFGATEAAHRRFEQVTSNWNCHLFLRVRGSGFNKPPAQLRAEHLAVRDAEITIARCNLLFLEECCRYSLGLAEDLIGDALTKAVGDKVIAMRDEAAALRATLEKIAEHPATVKGEENFGVGWAFSQVQKIAGAALTLKAPTP